MSWQLFRWAWRLESPLFVGMPPAGSINRTRLYVPAWTLWGALTAELTRHGAGDAVAEAETYQEVGAWLREHFRFSYLYPAERVGRDWCAWLPEYRDGFGLCWRREDGGDDELLGDRAFRARLLYTRPGTAITPTTETAEEGSLRETECLQTRWRDAEGQDCGPVAMVGYVFVRSNRDLDCLSPVRTIFVGGDARYGLGRLVRNGDPEPAKGFFSKVPMLDKEVPQVKSDRLFAHGKVNARSFYGDLELLYWWRQGEEGQGGANEEPCWRPGSGTRDGDLPWEFAEGGYWNLSG